MSYVRICGCAEYCDDCVNVANGWKCDRCARVVPDETCGMFLIVAPAGWGELEVDGVTTDVCPGCMVPSESAELRREEAEG